MATTTNDRLASAERTAEQDADRAVPVPYRLFADRLRTTYAGQAAARTAALETFGQVQRAWWDQWSKMLEVSTALLAPVTDRQLNERLAGFEHRATERQGEVRADLDRATAELREAQRESKQALTQTVREATREQRAARTTLDEAVEKLDGRLDRLTKAQAKQLEQINAGLAEQEQRLRDRLGDRIRNAVGAVEAAKPSDLHELRQQMTALTEAVTATRQELASLARDRRAEGAPAGRPAPANNSAPKSEATLEAPSKQ